MLDALYQNGNAAQTSDITRTLHNSALRTLFLAAIGKPCRGVRRVWLYGAGWRRGPGRKYRYDATQHCHRHCVQGPRPP
eukprot:g59145.t1